MLTPFTPLIGAGADLFDDKGMLMAVITTSGILIVFVVLVLLIFIFYAYGAIFRSMTASKEKKAAAKKAAEDAAKAAEQPSAAAPAPAPAAAPASDGEIPGEIIAVIAAAVAAMSGGKTYAVKKVTRAAQETGRRTAWAAAGLYENTRPF